MYTYIPFLLNFPPAHSHPIHLGHHRAPIWAPCAILQVPTSYLFYTQQCVYGRASPVAQQNMPVVQKTQVQSLGQEDPLEEGMVTHSSILA